MVRKATRSTMKAAEKLKSDSPKRTRSKTSIQHGRSGSKSDSDEDVPLSVTKNLSPTRVDKGSSENESDKDSKKPLKKRSRSMAMKEEIQQQSSHKSRWDKQHKSPPIKTIQQDNDEEVIEEQNSKGKSKNKNNSNNENVVNPETENENVQVTDQSPSDAKDDHETQAKNGEENKEIDVNTSEVSVAEKTSDQQSSEVPTEQNVETVVTENNASGTIPERASRSPSKEDTDNSSNKSKTPDRRVSSDRKSPERSRDSDKDRGDRNDRKSRDRRFSESSTKEVNEQKSENKHSEKSEDSKKIKLKRPPAEKQISESEDKEGRKEENGARKKITLKRLDNKQHLIEESKPPVENHGSSPKEQSHVDEWSSSYEINDDPRDNQGKPDEKPARKRITLKRSTVEDNKLPATIEKKEIFLGRSISLNENNDQRRKSTSESTTSDGKKRRSSAFDKSTSENEEKTQTPKKPTKVVKLNRTLLQELQEPPPPGEETLKKYKWGRSDTSYTDVDTLNLDALKQVCPTIEFLKEDEVNLEVVITENRIPYKERRKTFTELEEEEMEKIEAELNAEPEEIEIKENIIAMNRKISIVEDTASKLKPPPSPARNPVSEVLFITNLVRPFTVKQLKELLERTGKIVEDGFWTDRIKSKCYVYYEKIEEAEATRNALHGVNWPIGNGKKLIIDYATVDDLENAKNPPIPVKKEKSPEKENKKPIIEEEKDDKKSIRTVKREWDLGKEDEHRRRRSHSRSRERQRKHSRRSYTPEDYHGKKRKHEEPAPQKAMDDLFLKTKATPSIYWQPLSPEEIALKQQQRQARLEENKRRLEEISRTSTRGTHRDRGRDRNFRRR